MFNLSARWRLAVNAMPWPLYLYETDPVPIIQEAGWAPGPPWTGAENLTPPGFDPQTVQLKASEYPIDHQSKHVKPKMEGHYLRGVNWQEGIIARAIRQIKIQNRLPV